jgi:magnesium-transporting ATPase (P-type)
LLAETPLSGRANCLFVGTHVIGGTARAVVVLTGKEAEFGKISERLKLRPQETEFEHGVRQFGYLLLEVTLALVFLIFAVNTSPLQFCFSSSTQHRSSSEQDGSWNLSFLPRSLCW